eukprot:6128883-Ditylum_brightwellii.AAC.1
MADEEQMSSKHKSIQIARSISKASTPNVRKKLSKTVEELAGHQQGFPEGVVEFLEEKSSQKPPVEAKALILANNDIVEENEWTMVNSKGKLDMK